MQANSLSTQPRSSKVFNSALLIDIQANDTEEGSDLNRLNSSFTETTTTLQKYLSSDLLNRIEIISPVNNTFPSTKLSTASLKSSKGTTTSDDDLSLFFDENSNPIAQKGDGRFSFNPTQMMQFLTMQNRFFMSSGTHKNLQHPSVKKNELALNTLDDNSNDYLVEMFGRKGWICDECNNFNYESRMKCNRCKIAKAPKRISYNGESNNIEDLKNLRKYERKGDWTCENCWNLNFAFRVQCNRCQKAKNDIQNSKGN